MIALVALPFLAPSPWIVAFVVVPLLIAFLPASVRQHPRRLMVACLFAVVLAVGLYADDGDFLIRKPEICNHVTWTDIEYWEYGCYEF